MFINRFIPDSEGMKNEWLHWFMVSPFAENTHTRVICSRRPTNSSPGKLWPSGDGSQQAVGLRTWNESDFSWLILGMLHHHRRWSKEALIVWAMGFNWILVWFRYESELDVLNEYQRQMIHWFKHFNSTKKITNLFQPNYQLLVILELRPSLGDVLSAGINYGPALSRSEALRGDTSFASIWLHHRSLSLRHPRYTIIL